MHKMSIIRISIVCTLMLMLASAFVWAREDMYTTLATELSAVADTIHNPKIAIIPFTYVDKRKSSAGIIISERLTTRMVKLKKCVVVERNMLENVMQELHLEATGVIDAAQTKEIGKMLGVDAIITGTLMDISGNRVEVNARVVKTETTEVVATSSVNLDKDWDDAAQEQFVYQQPVVTSQKNDAVVEQVASQQPKVAQKQEVVYSSPARASHLPPVDGFIDIFMGSGGGTMDLNFANSAYPIRETDIAIDLNGDGLISNSITRTSVKFPGAKTEVGSMPLIGLRMGGFGKYFGGAFEVSYFTQKISKQTSSTFYFSKDDYFNVDVINILTGDIFLRYPGKYIQPYFGLGIGMTLNHITSPYIYSYDASNVWQKGLDSLEIGFTYRVPMGLRFNLGDFGSMFIEVRPTSNSFTFDRGIKSEKDTVTMNTNLILLGYSGRFGNSHATKY